MKYEIIGDTLPVVELVLDKGEQIYTESGGMSWMDPCFEMETSTRGGALKAIKRSFSGNSLFLTTYTCQADKGRIAFQPLSRATSGLCTWRRDSPSSVLKQRFWQPRNLWIFPFSLRRV